MNYPAEISINEENPFPEGIEYDQRENQFLISSVTRGTVGQVRKEIYSKFINDADLFASLELYTDNSKKRLLITTANFDGSLSTLAAKMSLGERIFMQIWQLEEGLHFANDVTVNKRKGLGYRQLFGNN